MRRLPTTLLLPVVLCATGCATLSYDLSSVPFDVSARPAAAGQATEPFTVTGKAVMWVHGLCGKDQPDVGALLLQQCGADCSGVTDFRVEVAASFHDWLVTHLTLGFIRMKTVTIHGQRSARPAE